MCVYVSHFVFINMTSILGLYRGLVKVLSLPYYICVTRCRVWQVRSPASIGDAENVS